ncbi:MAG: hypothetical protein Q4F67_05010 [Propionibacteriaceae bacterium]|nr:hypothetical protein [Propionibacteriaceae bacterium]
MTDMNSASSSELVDAVSAILYTADPVGINAGTNPDEYDVEAETIVAGLPQARSHADVVDLTHATFVRWFDEEIAGPAENYAEVSETIWQVWRDDGAP